MSGILLAVFMVALWFATAYMIATCPKEKDND